LDRRIPTYCEFLGDKDYLDEDLDIPFPRMKDIEQQATGLVISLEKYF
jgi:hypothetical protein